MAIVNQFIEQYPESAEAYFTKAQIQNGLG